MNHEEFVANLRKDPNISKLKKSCVLICNSQMLSFYARMAKGWSQTELARRVNTKQANISRIEASLANPTLDFIRRLCDTLEIELAFCGPEVSASTPQVKTISNKVSEEPDFLEGDYEVISFSTFPNLDKRTLP